MRRTIRIACALAAALAGTPALAQADFSSCLSGLRSAALSKGVSASTFDRATRGLEPDMTVIERMNNQPEFKTPIWDYLATLNDEEKVAEGQQMLRRYASVLAAAEARFGVDRHTIVAVWGVESDYGKAGGSMPLVQALATGACFAPRRQSFFRDELVSTLRIIERGDLNPADLKGSWAGAFGHTQFIPSTYLRLAVDGDGDGRRDLVNSVSDALHSTANFMAKAGWQTGNTWGYEVRVPDGYSGPSGRTKKHPLSFWAARGIKKVNGGSLNGAGNAGLLMPAGRDGPAFLVFKNYDCAYSYNGADSYALAISMLSDRLKGRPGIQTAWPTDDPPLSRAERRLLQQKLTARGYDVGEPDGRVGQKTRDAIKEIERQLGMKPTGRPGGRVLQALR
ncbi:lytic murein transglycosylase [Enterovirga sp. CN4-39]|uniref:lytic murein transglycosylase n=1 Tax=Enterovirga sp. CN4-39 TaxID=3400910 RepID=UPI003C084723